MLNYNNVFNLKFIPSFCLNNVDYKKDLFSHNLFEIDNGKGKRKGIL
jgi:hypothetical protein